MKQGDNVLIWGASGGLGGFATQYALNGGATPVCVVSNEEKAEICRSHGRRADHQPHRGGLQVLEGRAHPGPEGVEAASAPRSASSPAARTSTSSSSTRAARPSARRVYVTRKGGTIITCASTSGYMHEYDNRYLWMNLKRIIASHFANYRESWEANRLIAKGKIHPTLSRTYPLDEIGQAALDVHHNAHQGKVGVLCLAPEEGLGVRDAELRAQHEDAINRFRGRLSAPAVARPGCAKPRPIVEDGRVHSSPCEGARPPHEQARTTRVCPSSTTSPRRTPRATDDGRGRCCRDAEKTQVIPPDQGRRSRRGRRAGAAASTRTTPRRAEAEPSRGAGADEAAPEPTRQVPVAAEARRSAPGHPAGARRRSRRRGRAAGPGRGAPPLPPLPDGPPRRLRQGRRRRPAAPARRRAGRASASSREPSRGAGSASSRRSSPRLAASSPRPRPRRTPASAAAPARCCAWPRRRPPRCATVAQRDADEIREQATRDAQAIRADASPRGRGHAHRPAPRSSTRTGPG